MYAPLGDHSKFDRNISFLNEIKSDYVLARHLFMLSNFHSPETEDVDRGVILYSPFSETTFSTYLQLMKASFRIAVDTLDKVAFFINDYCGVGLKSEKVYFKTVFC